MRHLAVDAEKGAVLIPSTDQGVARMKTSGFRSGVGFQCGLNPPGGDKR